MTAAKHEFITPLAQQTGHIIVVDDEVNICRSVKACLGSEGYQVSDFIEPQAALNSMRNVAYECAIIDICLGEQSGIALFEQMRQEKLNIPVIFISGNASLDEAVQSVKLGAYDFLEKPFSADKLAITVKNCLDHQLLHRRLNALQSAQHQEQLIGNHPSIVQLRKDISKVAMTDAAILISGESGTGKELIAQSIHQQSKRATAPFVKVNCSAIPHSLIDSALFGHVKGAFTGAEQHKKGFFELAHQGTLFLDEIGDMPLASQASLLRALESGEIQKVGSDKINKVDVRVLAASHKNLKQQAKQGQFREDLFYRINVIPLTSPSLRARASDIPLLVNHLLSSLCQRHGFSSKTIEPDCYAILSRYQWPGNVRELVNTLERMLIMGDNTLAKHDIPAEMAQTTTASCDTDGELSLKEYKQQWERELLINKLKQFHGNITHVAKSLGIDRTYLHKKISLYDIKRAAQFE